MESPAETTWTGYSLAERDRRWAAVRKNAVEAGFDCIFVPLCVDPFQLNLSSDSKRGVRSDGRYLTLMENAAVVRGGGAVAGLGRGAGVAEAGIEEMAAAERPGVDAGHLYARVTVRMLELGSERHDWALYAAPLGEEAERHTNPPLGLWLRAG